MIQICSISFLNFAYIPCMNTIAVASRIPEARYWQAALVGGMIAGTVDLIAAFISYGWGVPRGIASGLLGPSARQGGVGTYILGICLHFFIALSAATVYSMTSRKLEFLKEHALVCGLFFGIAIFLVMNLIVVPLSAIHYYGPFSSRGMIQGLLVHMFGIGLPISFSVRLLAK
jgi:hypothetical protein